MSSFSRNLFAAVSNTFFLRRNYDPLTLSRSLMPLELMNPERGHLQQAASLYQEARRQKSKASLADALLAAVCHERKEKLVSFDGDFAYLGLKETNGLWLP